MTTQLLNAIALSDQDGLEIDRQYLFSLQVSDEHLIRIVTTNDKTVYYASLHDFLLSWKNISSLGYANTKEEFLKLLNVEQGKKED